MKKSFCCYTAFGDSLTFGTGSDTQEGFAARVFQQLQRRDNGAGSVQSHIHGVVGATASELLCVLRSNEELRRQVSAAALLTISAGGNDLIRAAVQKYINGASVTMRPAMRRFSDVYDELVKEVVTLQGNRGSTIVLLNSYNPFPVFKDAVLWVQFVNRCVMRTAERYGQAVKVARVYEHFSGREDALLSDDGVHPNDEGHQVLAECVLETIEA